MSKVGDIISCKVAIINKKPKIVEKTYTKDHLVKFFEIIGIVNYYENCNGYLILIGDDYTGWNISKFHIENLSVPNKFLFKKFYEISSLHII